MDNHNLLLALKEMSAFDPEFFVHWRQRCGAGGPGSFGVKDYQFPFHPFS
jgi:hypothetical protein